MASFTNEKHGDPMTWCEPAWAQGFPSPYYTPAHMEFRKRVREFVEREVAPIADDLVDRGELYPEELHRKAFEAGVSGVLYDAAVGGTKPPTYDKFYDVILWEELYRNGNPHVLAQLSINSMALPPIIRAGSDWLKQTVVREVVQGRKSCCLAITEPYAGSDVAGIRTTAVREGDVYVVNGTKKYITGGLFAFRNGFFTTAVRIGKPDGPVSILVIPGNLPGISVNKIPTGFDTTHGTTRVNFDDVRVPATFLVGEEGKGLPILFANLNSERLTLSVQALTSARTVLRESMKEALTRKTFGKKLVEHPVVRARLAEMAREVESCQALVDSVAFLFKSGIPDDKLGAQCALLKAQASKALENCSRLAVLVFGGSGLIKEGRGRLVERISRDPPEKLIPGGAYDILIDLAARQALRSVVKL